LYKLIYSCLITILTILFIKKKKKKKHVITISTFLDAGKSCTPPLKANYNVTHQPPSSSSSGKKEKKKEGECFKTHVYNNITKTH
jgi:hypothetical protein